MVVRSYFLKVRLVCILAALPILGFAQGQNEKLFIYNVGFGAVSSGVGAVINKKPGEDWKKLLVRGLWQGSIGGAVNYASKKSVYLVVKHENLVYALPARVLNCAGNSIIQNAAKNQPFLQNWSLEYAFLRLDISFAQQTTARVRLLPESILTSAIAWKGNSFDVKTTLSTGLMAFKAKEWLNQPTRTDGINYGRTLVYFDHSTRYHVIAHELVHEFQYREWQVANAFFRPMVDKWKRPGLKKIFTKYLYPDIPYFALAYMTVGIYPHDQQFYNPFEFEAERFASNQYVKIR